MSSQFNPINDSRIKAITELSAGLSREQLLWIGGYFQGLIGSHTEFASTLTEGSHAQKTKLTILYGTHTGRSKTIASALAEKIAGLGAEVQTFALDDYKTRQLPTETNVVFIVSTHGEGEPPAMAEDFYSFITGKRAPKLPNLNYAVVALGDKSYKLFCKTGIDIDQALSGLGSNSMLPVLKLDVDFEDEISQWINEFTQLFASKTGQAPTNINLSSTTNSEANYTRKHPFKATVLEKVKITGRDSDKEVYHVELSLEGSGITYEPGDSVGILANNPVNLVDSIIKKCGFTGSELVKLKDGEFQISDALTDRLEITVLNRDVIQTYQEKSGNEKLTEILADD